MARADFADDVTGARRAIDAHAELSKRLAKVPVDELEAQGKTLCNLRALLSIVFTILDSVIWINHELNFLNQLNIYLSSVTATVPVDFFVAINLMSIKSVKCTT